MFNSRCCYSVDRTPMVDMVDVQVKKLREEASEKSVRWKSGTDTGGVPSPPRSVQSWSLLKLTRGSPCGLRNIGNSCYMNAVLQCLCAVDNHSLDPHGSDSLVAEYERLVSALRYSRNGVITPSRFKRAVGKLDVQFRGTDQQDAHEFLVFLLEEMKQNGVWRDRGAVERLSLVILVSQLRCCTCSHVSFSTEPFNCLSLQIPNRTNSTLSVIDCLSSFFDTEEISVDQKWRCETCKAVSTGKKQLLVDSFPKLLVIHLKRFQLSNGQLQKNSARMTVPSGVLMGQHKYSLTAVVKHSGSRTSGHYVAEVKHGNRWFSCNDASVKEVRRDRTPCSKVFLLFFSQVS